MCFLALGVKSQTAHPNKPLSLAMQDSDADAYVEVPLLFSIQDESLSALHQANLNAKAAHGLVLNTTTADYMVRTCFSLASQTHEQSTSACSFFWLP